VSRLSTPPARRRHVSIRDLIVVVAHRDLNPAAHEPGVCRGCGLPTENGAEWHRECLNASPEGRQARSRAPRPAETPAPNGGSAPIRVLEVATGRVFGSLADAGKVADVSPKTIGRRIDRPGSGWARATADDAPAEVVKEPARTQRPRPGNVDRAHRALEMRRAGLTYELVGDRLGCTNTRARALARQGEALEREGGSGDAASPAPQEDRI
jgi:hypothetical protein